MPLLTIADLNQPDEELRPYLELASTLSNTYYDFIASPQSDAYKYTVDVKAGKERAPGIHASEISNCQRQVVYSIMGEPREQDPDLIDVNMLMRFRIGHAVHAMLQNEWHEIAKWSQSWTHGRIQFQDEVAIKPSISKVAEEWGIHSSCDGVITILDSNGNPIVRIGLEIKTESDAGYNKLRSPRDYHLEQTCTYMATLDLPLMWIFYYNKSNSNYSTSYPPYLFRFDPVVWEELQMRFARAHHNASLRVLPDREEGMYCRWCSFSKACKPPKMMSKKQKNVPLSPGMGKRSR